MYSIVSVLSNEDRMKLALMLSENDSKLINVNVTISDFKKFWWLCETGVNYRFAKTNNNPCPILMRNCLEWRENISADKMLVYENGHHKYK